MAERYFSSTRDESFIIRGGGGTFGGGWGRVHLGGSENFGDLLGVGNK